jgi:hypothetical protein
MRKMVECKKCGDELQKIPILGTTNEFYYYCNGCFVNGAKLKDCFSPTFTEKESWRTGLNGHRSTGRA